MCVRCQETTCSRGFCSFSCFWCTDKDALFFFLHRVWVRFLLSCLAKVAKNKRMLHLYHSSCHCPCDRCAVRYVPYLQRNAVHSACTKVLLPTYGQSQAWTVRAVCKRDQRNKRERERECEREREDGRQIVFCFAVLCHVMSCHVMSCHVMSCHVMSCHVMSCHVMSCHVMSCHVMSCHVMSCHVMSCHVMSCHVMSCHVMSCGATLCCDM